VSLYGTCLNNSPPSLHIWALPTPLACVSAQVPSLSQTQCVLFSNLGSNPVVTSGQMGWGGCQTFSAHRRVLTIDPCSDPCCKPTTPYALDCDLRSEQPSPGVTYLNRTPAQRSHVKHNLVKAKAGTGAPAGGGSTSSYVTTRPQQRLMQCSDKKCMRRCL
jgi:hypothetical protein